MEIIPYGRQKIDSSDLKAVQQVLSSDIITQGPVINNFERAIADYCGAKYAVAVSSGTAALHLAILAAGLKKGDEAITSPITFLATPNSVIYSGATPVFADIDYDTVNLDPKCLQNKITKRTRAVLPVHFAGLPASMDEIRRIAVRYRLTVIEDASHALGATYRGDKVGSCKYSDMAVFSFHPVKHITTGEGGCITTNSKYFYEKLKALRSHGVYRTAAAQKKSGGWYYEMRELGFNYRITDFQCALGLNQLNKLEEFIRHRARAAVLYDQSFSELSDFLKVPAQGISHHETHARHLYLLRLKEHSRSLVRRRLYDYLRQNSIHAQVHYLPVYQQPYYQEHFPRSGRDCPNAERYYKEVLSLPLFAGITDEQITKTINAVKDFLKTRPVTKSRRFQSSLLR